MNTPSRVRGHGRGQTHAAPAAKTTTMARETANQKRRNRTATAAKAAKARAAENKRAQKRCAREAQCASDKAMIVADEAMIAANKIGTIFRCNAAEYFTRRCQKCTRVRKNTLQRIQKIEEPLTEEGASVVTLDAGTQPTENCVFIRCPTVQNGIVYARRL